MADQKEEMKGSSMNWCPPFNPYANRHPSIPWGPPIPPSSAPRLPRLEDVPEDGLTISKLEINVAKHLYDELDAFSKYQRARLKGQDMKALEDIEKRYEGTKADLLYEYLENRKKAQADCDEARGKVVQAMLKKFREIEPFIAEKGVELAKIERDYWRQVIEDIKTFTTKLLPGTIKLPEDFQQVAQFAVCELTSDYHKYMQEVRFHERTVSGYTEFLSNIKKLVKEAKLEDKKNAFYAKLLAEEEEPVKEVEDDEEDEQDEE